MSESLPEEAPLTWATIASEVDTWPVDDQRMFYMGMQTAIERIAYAPDDVGVEEWELVQALSSVMEVFMLYKSRGGNGLPHEVWKVLCARVGLSAMPKRIDERFQAHTGTTLPDGAERISDPTIRNLLAEANSPGTIFRSPMGPIYKEIRRKVDELTGQSD